jgi:hypothetical protein
LCLKGLSIGIGQTKVWPGQQQPGSQFPDDSSWNVEKGCWQPGKQKICKYGNLALSKSMTTEQKKDRHNLLDCTAEVCLTAEIT